MQMQRTIICEDCCFRTATFSHPDELEGWRILRPAKAYFDLEGRCPHCDELYELSDIRLI